MTCQGLGLANGKAWARTPGPLYLVQNIFHCTLLGGPKGVNQKLLLRAPEAQAGGSPRPLPAPTDDSPEFHP